MSGYVRDRWGVEQRFPGGPVYAITQTADGYLWIGAEKGLVRFDGLSFRLFDHTNSPALPAGPVLDLMTDVEGNLWIRPQSRDMLRYREGVFQDVMADLDSARSGVTAMCRGPKGEALFAVRSTGTFLYSDGRFEKLLSTAEPPRFLVISMARTGDGKIWMGTRDAGLCFMSDGRISTVKEGLPDRKINSLLVIDDRALWIGTDNGVVRWNGEVPNAGVSDLPGHVLLANTQALAMTRDRQSNIWIGTGKGLLRLNASGVSSLEEGDRGSTAAVNTIFEDREGNLWVGSTRGLERLRDSAFMTYSVSGESSPGGNGAVYVDADGRTWYAPLAGGLYWQKDGQTGEVKSAGLSEDVVYSLTGSKGELWIGRRRGGLTHLSYNGASFTTRTYTQAEGLAQNSIYAVHQSRDQTVWAGSVNGGVTRLKDGKLTTYTAANGLASNMVTSILEGLDGTMWFGTANGMSSLSQDKWRVYGSLDGLPPGAVNCLLEDSNGAIWIGTDNGISVLRSDQVEVPREAPESLHEQILGVAEDGNGSLWLSTSSHVLRVDREKLLGGVVSESDVRGFGLADGLLSVEGVKRHRSVVIDTLGRIWLSTSRGLSVVDPKRVAGYSVPAIVHIEGITADGRTGDANAPVNIASGRQRITFSYAALSLSIPERIRFRYMLDGFDQGWSEPVATHEAIYTNLSPGSYSFRVIASNSEGVWNSAEAAIRIEIEPVFWQTLWFRLCCLAAVALAALVFFRLRIRQLSRKLNARFEERLAERTRIAQELHDTLLQGFLSASMQLHVAADQLPADSPARPQLGRVLQLIGRVIEEGRNAVRGLRSTGSGGPLDLEQAFTVIPQELAIKEQIGFRVIVKGRGRPLHPLIRDEVYRIGREALANAFRHSRAKNIEVEVEYASGHLRILVRDDGCGIDPHVLQSGREGHWGLPGMRERAEAIGARLRVWSRTAAGTEVDLSVPSHVAFQIQASNSGKNWFARWYRPKNELKTEMHDEQRPDKQWNKRDG